MNNYLIRLHTEILTVIEFDCRKSCVSPERRPTSVGMPPNMSSTKQDTLAQMADRTVHINLLHGSSPDKEFSYNAKICNDLRDPISVGMVPPIPERDKSSNSKDVMVPSSVGRMPPIPEL